MICGSPACNPTVAGGVPTQLVENQIPPDPFQTVMPMVSPLPGLPSSVMLNCKALLPETETGASGLVMSWMLALPVNCALQGEVEVAPVQPDAQALLTKAARRAPAAHRTIRGRRPSTGGVEGGVFPGLGAEVEPPCVLARDLDNQHGDGTQSSRWRTPAASTVATSDRFMRDSVFDDGRETRMQLWPALLTGYSANS